MPPVDWKKIVSDPSGSSPEEPVKEENYLEEFRARVRKSIDEGNISLSSVGIPEPPVERSLPGEVLVAGVRGAGKAIEYTGRGIQELGSDSVGGALRSAGESIQQADFLAPSEELKTGQAGLARRTLAGAAESIPMSAVPLATAAAGAAIGAATTVNPVGAAIGGLAGGAAGLGTVFYGGTYSAEKERAVKEFEQLHPDWTPEQREQEASSFAHKQALWETGTEGVSDLVTAGIGKALAKGIVKEGATGAKAVLRDLLGTGGPKEMAKKFAQVYAAEGGSEIAAYLGQAANEQAYGLGDGPTLTGALDTAVTSLWMTGALGAAGAGLNYSERNKTISGLNSENKLIRDKAAEKVETKVAEKFGPDSAKQWRSIFESSVTEGKGGGFSIDSPLFGAAAEAYAPEGGGVLEKALGATQPTVAQSAATQSADPNAQFDAAADEAALEANPEYEAASALAGEAAGQANSEAQFETESVATRKRAAGIPLDAAEEAALAVAEQRLARPAPVTIAPVSPVQDTVQAVRQAGSIAVETPEQAQQGYEAYQPEPPVNPASEYGQQQAEFEKIQKEAAEYNRLKNIPDKLPELPEDLRNADSLSRPQLLSVAKKYNIPTVNEKTGKAIGIKAAVKRFAESEQKRIASETRLRTPEEQTRLDQLAGRTPERLAAQAARERSVAGQRRLQQAAVELDNAPLKPAPGGEAYFAGVENIAAEREAQGEFASREGEDVADALPVMMRELSQGTAGRRLRNAGESYGYDADTGTMIGEPSSYPKWVQEDSELSKAGRKTIERVAELARSGGEMTGTQAGLWSALKEAARKEYSRNPEIQQGVEFDRLAADGYNFETAEGGLLASDLSEGDSVALLEDGAIVRYTSQGVDENTGRVVLERDGGGTKELGGLDPVEPVAVKLNRSEVPFSKSQAPLENAADVRAELAKEYGAGWIGRAERRGLFKFIDPAAAERLVVEMGIDPKRAADGRIEGFITPDGQIHLVQGNIAKDQALGVVAHELGSHAMRSGFTKEQDWLDVLDHSDRLLAKGDESVTEARRRAVEAGTPDSLLREETVAYLSNIAPKHGIVRNLIAKLKQFMINNGLADKFFISKLTAADLQTLAQGATKAAIKGKAAPEWAKSVDTRLSAKITPDLRVEATNKKGETVTRPLAAKAIAAQKPLAAVKEAVETRTEELRSGLTEGDMLARKIEEEAQKKVNPRKQAQIEKDLLEQVRVLKKQHLQPEIQDMANEIFGTIDPEARRMTPAKEANLKATRAEIERLKAEGTDIDPALEAKVARLDRRRIGDMLPGEAQALLDVANELAYVNNTKNKLLAVERGQDAAELSRGIIAPIEAKPSKRYIEAKKTGQKAERGKNPILDLGRQLLGDPASTFKTLMLDLGRANEKSSAVKLAQTVAERQNVELKHRKELDELLVKSIGKNWQALAESKEWNAEQDVNGRKLTSGEKVYLKYSLNDQNVSDSIEKMGYRKRLDTKATKMSRAEREAIKLNPEEQKVYDALSDYFESTYQVLNPAHVEMKGWTLPAAGRGKYLPKSVSNLTLADELGSIIRSGSVENTGVVQDRIGTLNEINLKDIFEVITRQRDIASKYAAYAPMVRDFNLVFRSPELKNTLQMEYGLEKNGKSIVENYVDDLLRDLQGNKVQVESGADAAVRKIRTNTAGALLAFRLTTPLMQLTGFTRALAHISPQNLAKALHMNGGFDEAVKWNMRAYARREVGIDREIADNRNKRLIQLGMEGIQKMDELVTGRLWSATKLQTAQETGLRGEELLAETSKRFDAVLDTQGGHTMADLSMTNRIQSELAKMFTIFSSDKFAMLNELKRGLIIREHTGDWKPLARASAGMILSAAIAAGVATVVSGAVGGKDKDYEEEFLKNLAGSLPLFDQLVSMFQGFNPSSAGIEAIGDAANAAGRIALLVKKQATGETVTAEQYSKALQAVINSASLAAGVPAKNIMGNLGLAKRLALGKDALERVESELRGLEDFDFEKRKAKVTKGKQGAELRAALSKLRAEFAGFDQEKVAAARRLTAAKKRIKEIDRELEGEVPAALRSRREKLREEIAERAVR